MAVGNVNGRPRCQRCAWRSSSGATIRRALSPCRAAGWSSAPSPGSGETGVSPRTSKTAPKPWPHSSSSPPSSLTSDALLGVVGTRQTLAATGEAGCGFGERTLAGARGNDGDAPTAALGTSPAQVTAGDPFPDLRPDAEAPATPGLSQNRLCDCVLVGDHLVAR